MNSDRETLFDGFSHSQRQAFLDQGKREHYSLQSQILKGGEIGSEMLLIEAGAASVWVQDTKVNEVGVGRVIGVSTLIEPHPRTATLVAETDLSALRFSRTAILQHLEKVSPKLFQTFFLNAFRIHVNLVRQCEERIVQLSHELSA